MDDDAKIFSGQIAKALENGDLTLFNQTLSIIDWVDSPPILDRDSSTKLVFDTILQAIYKVGLGKFARALLERYDSTQPLAIRGEPDLSAKTQLMFSSGDDIVLKWLHQEIPEPTYTEMIMQMNDFDGGEDLSIMLDRLEELVPARDKSLENYDTILWAILPPEYDHPWNLESSNRALLSWLVPKASKARMIEEPEYASKFQPQKEIILRKMLERVIADSGEDIRSFIAVFNEIQKSKDLMRIVGPFHALVQIDYIPEDVEDFLQMLCPMHLDYGPPSYNPLDNAYLNPDPEENVGSWFTGYCWECFKGIQEKTWSVRRPLEAGGWYGCYCSFQCADWAAQDPRCQPLSYQLEHMLLNSLRDLINEL